MPTRIPRTGVQRRELRNGSRHPLPQRGGLKDLDLRAQPQELRLGMAVRLDRHAGQHPTVGLRLTGRRRVRDGASHQVRQPLQRRRRQPHQRLALVQPSAELPDVLIPVRRQIEPHGPVELVGQHRQLLDLADPEGAHASTGPGHQVPLAGLEDQPVRLEPPVDDLRPALVPHRDDLLPPHGVDRKSTRLNSSHPQDAPPISSSYHLPALRTSPYGSTRRMTTCIQLSYRTAMTCCRDTASATAARWSELSPSWYQPGASRWNRCRIRVARSRSGSGSAAASFSCAAATASASPSSAAAPGNPASTSPRASSALSPVSRV